jgi:hypothetical protein
MPIDLTCPCGKRLQVSDEFAGRQGRCPACGGLLQIPERDGTVTGVAPPPDGATQAVVTARGVACPKGPGATEGVVTPAPGSAAESHGVQRGGPEADDNARLTSVGCVLTLLAVAVIVGVAIPIVRWRHPATGQPLPRLVAVVAPVLIGAVVHALGSLLLRCIGLRVWSKRETDADG